MEAYLSPLEQAELERLAAERRAVIKRQISQTLQRLRDRMRVDVLSGLEDAATKMKAWERTP